MKTEDVEKFKSLLIAWRDKNIALNEAWQAAVDEVNGYWPIMVEKGFKYDETLSNKCEDALREAREADKDLEDFYYVHVHELRLLWIDLMTEEIQEEDDNG